MRFEQWNQFGFDWNETLKREIRKHGLKQIGNNVLLLSNKKNKQLLNTKLGIDAVIH